MMRIRKTVFVCLLAAGSACAQTSPHGKLSIPCQTCHTTDSWEMRHDAQFDHRQTGFPLEGQHKTLKCASCHAKLLFSGLSRTCTSCHPDIHKSELGANCTRCHTVQSWKITDMIQRHQRTRFPLVGRHAALDCQSCHGSAAQNRFTGAPLTCFGCHRTDFEKTTSPNHAFAGFSTDCARCHTVNSFGWTSGFDHARTAFPLSGRHIAVSCTSCHKNGVFRNTPLQCYACHQSEYQSAKNPNHVVAQFPVTCQTCHSTTSWTPAAFDHANTRFPLTGAHRTVTCNSCHVNNQYAGLGSNCVDCHRTDYTGATNPNHQTAGFAQTCTQCHTTTAWKPASFDHTTTKFALTGKHVTATCQSCHVNNNYQLVYTDCYQCHQTDFQRPTNPNHAAANFSHLCQSCHTTSAWKPSSFDHNTTRFQLTGAHRAVLCTDCHTNNRYAGLPMNCIDCHRTDYTGALNPNHQTAAFPQICTQCHTTTAWRPASFDHNTTKLPLTGRHVTATCQSCHVNGNYQLVYTDCYQCHQSDFQRPTTPNHVTANFSRQCQTCHTTTAWVPSTFDHDRQYFKIYSGKHRGRWTQCTQCHANPATYKEFTCISCHEHNKTDTDKDHQGVSNYVYSATSCYNCHKDI